MKNNRHAEIRKIKISDFNLNKKVLTVYAGKSEERYEKDTNLLVIVKQIGHKSIKILSDFYLDISIKK